MRAAALSRRDRVGELCKTAPAVIRPCCGQERERVGIAALTESGCSGRLKWSNTPRPPYNDSGPAGIDK
jgi:hypothetical protein